MKEIILKMIESKFVPGFIRCVIFSNKYLKRKGWYRSWSLHRPVTMSGDPIPWMTYSSINFIEQKLLLKPMQVFEFGSGNSTVWFASRVQSIISIESDVCFYKHMQKNLASLENVTYEIKTPGENYYQKILEFKSEFDVIIIDGKERVACAKNCLGALKEDGVIIFDNSDRVEYQDAYEYLSENGFKKIDFTGVGPLVYSDWQTTIYYREKNCFEI